MAGRGRGGGECDSGRMAGVSRQCVEEPAVKKEALKIELGRADEEGSADQGGQDRRLYLDTETKLRRLLDNTPLDVELCMQLKASQNGAARRKLQMANQEKPEGFGGCIYLLVRIFPIEHTVY